MDENKEGFITCEGLFLIYHKAVGSLVVMKWIVYSISRSASVIAEGQIYKCLF
jgi:hypothetical protein